ncbi:MAG: phosphoenolpyruvate--protein phosphotransferase [Lentisphaeria bacterium]|nr:phosphoenolpyruvate--protein phosphotransferase [Lentisphaeria bacterium]
MLTPSCNIQAIPVAPGIAIGRVMRIGETPREQPEPVVLAPEMAEPELARFHSALEKTGTQLAGLSDKLKQKLQDDEAGIFDAHILILEDQLLISEVEKGIKQDHFSAEYAVFATIEKFSAVFNGVNDEYLKERALDLRDVGNRILDNLSGVDVAKIAYNEPRIIIASNLTPSETVGLEREFVLGFATETGSATSHTAILARSLKLPAVVGVPKELLDKLTIADKLIVDGFSGKLIVNPDRHTEEAYLLKQREEQKFYFSLNEENNLPPETSDGFRLQLAANLDADQDYNEVKQTAAYGVGLFRTEFIFMDPNQLPDEERQYNIYKKLLVAAGNAPVTIRTIDVGGDKLNTAILRSTEQNPFLGLRGIRLCLREQRELFATQLRALLRAGVHGDLRVMLPMVSSIFEVKETKEIIAKLQQDLAKEGVPCVEKLKLGVMIETPVAAIIAQQLAPEVDFFSIGTNDLIQYTMAVDRSNERVAYLYRPTHPAILHLIRNTVEAAREYNLYVSVCGQMAESVMYTPLLLGLGVHELSMPTASIPVQRRMVRSLERLACEELVQKALQCSNATEVQELVRAMVEKCAPEMLER